VKSVVGRQYSYFLYNDGFLRYYAISLAPEIKTDDDDDKK